MLAGGVGLDWILERKFERAVDHLPTGNVLPVHQRDGNTGVSRATCATNAVKISLFVFGAFKVDDVCDAFNVNAARGNIGCHETANNPYAQSSFDCRDILLPKGNGKGRQRRRSDLRNVLFTIATQGEYSPVDGKSKNGLWWTQAKLETHTGIGRDQLRRHIDWLVSVGLVHRQRRMNSTTKHWVDQKVLRGITQRQNDDRQSYRAQKDRQLDAGEIREDERIPEWDPEDLELIYFPTQEVISEAPTEALEEAQTEALLEALPETQYEALTQPWAEALAEAHEHQQKS